MVLYWFGSPESRFVKRIQKPLNRQHLPLILVPKLNVSKMFFALKLVTFF
jgi:hypothetical protein